VLNLTPTELERLTIFQAAELARRRRSRGLRLNQAEAEALLLDEALELARDGETISRVRDRVSRILTTDDVLPGVAALVPMLVVEGQFPDGTRLITVFDPIGPGTLVDDVDPLGRPGEIAVLDGDIELNGHGPSLPLTITNTGDRPIHVTSHMHLVDVNRALVLDRVAAQGRRLDIAAGTTVRFEPGQTTTVATVVIGQAST
jgi:urease subunit gamma/beta